MRKTMLIILTVFAFVNAAFADDLGLVDNASALTGKIGCASSSRFQAKPITNTPSLNPNIKTPVFGNSGAISTR